GGRPARRAPHRDDERRRPRRARGRRRPAAVILRERSLVALLVAETISTTGMQMTWLALPWFVLTTTGSAGRMVLVLAAEAVGLALFGLPGGSVLARLGPRRMMMLSDGIRGPLTLLIPILHWLGLLSFPLLLALVFALGAFSAGYVAARVAEERGGFLDGLRWLVRDPLLRTWSVAFVVGDAAWYAFFAAVPVLVVADYGADPKIAGWIFASFGVGAVAGNVVSL